MKKTIILIHGVRGTHHGLSSVASYLSENIITDPLGFYDIRDSATNNYFPIGRVGFVQ